MSVEDASVERLAEANISAAYGRPVVVVHATIPTPDEHGDYDFRQFAKLDSGYFVEIGWKGGECSVLFPQIMVDRIVLKPPPFEW